MGKNFNDTNEIRNVTGIIYTPGDRMLDLQPRINVARSSALRNVASDV